MTDSELGYIYRSGRVVHQEGRWLLIYHGTIDGRHEFVAEKVLHTINLGSITLNKAKEILHSLIKNEDVE